MNFHSERIGGACQFAIFYDALNCPRHERVRVTSQFLGITEQTMRRYLSGKAEPPAPFVRLLWHESHFGRETLDSHTHFGMVTLRGLTASLEQRNAKLLGRIAQLETEIADMKTAMTENRPRLVAMNSSFYQVA
jgi:hypothetical protein